MKHHPDLYGLKGPGGRPLRQDELEAALMEKLVMENIATLTQHGLVGEEEGGRGNVNPASMFLGRP